MALRTGASRTSTPESSTVIARDTLSEKVYARLRAGLMTGSYEPGERMNISRIARTFDTSPTPVREAMMQLVREGALELRPGHRLRVPGMDLERYVEVRAIRIPLERLAAELAAQHITPNEIMELEYQARRCLDAEERELWKEALVANQEFHFAIYRASRSPMLVRVIENLWLLTGPFINHLYPGQVQYYRSGEPHGRILRALKARDSAEAAAAVEHDIMSGSETIIARTRDPQDRTKTETERKRRSRSERVGAALT